MRSSRLNIYLKTLCLVLFLGLSSTNFSQIKGKSSITGQKFKVHKKPIKKRPLNYINSIQAVVGAGPTTYYGDLCDKWECYIPRWGASIGGQYRINELMSARVEFNYMRLAADDANSEVNSARNLNFRSSNYEGSVVFVGEIFRYNKMFRRRKVFSPYYFTGFGIVSYNPYGEDPLTGEWVALRPLTTEGVEYNNIAFTVPYGGGVRIKVNPILNVSVEFGYRWTFTDYIDDVSSTYGEGLSGQAERLSDKSNSIYSEPGKIRGNPSRNDGYFMLGIKAEYTIKVTHQHYNINSNVSRFRTIKSVKKK